MKITKLITPILFMGSLSTNIQASNFDYYSDGVYDAYIQLSRDLKEGVNERYMTEYAGKYIVAVDVQNSSTVDIIFYKTIGKKLGIRPIVVRYLKNKRNYLAFDASRTKADAARLQKRLIQYGLRPRLLKGGDGYSFKRNPVVAKRLIGNLNKGKTKKISKKKTTRKTTKKLLKIEYSSSEDFRDLKRRFCSSGFIQKRSIHMGGKNYRVGTYINGFKIIDTKNSSSGWAALLLGHDTLYYKLKKTSCGNDILSSAKKNVNTTKTKKISIKKPKKKNSKVFVPMENIKDLKLKNKARIYKSVVCDFTKIKTAKNIDKKFVRIADTTYANKKLQVDIKEQDDGWKIRHSGAEILYLSDKYFKKACK